MLVGMDSSSFRPASTEVARLEQVRLGAGMTVAGSEAAKSEIGRMATGKHGDSGMAMEPESDQHVLNEGISRAGLFFE